MKVKVYQRVFWWTSARKVFLETQQSYKLSKEERKEVCNLKKQKMERDGTTTSINIQKMKFREMEKV